MNSDREERVDHCLHRYSLEADALINTQQDAISYRSI